MALCKKTEGNMTELENVNRRDFLRGVTLTSLGMAVAAEEILISEASAQDAPAGAPVTCAVIGLGPRGREILASLAKVPGAPVAAICDTYTSPAYIKRSTDIVASAAVQTDYRKVLESKDIQAVFVATPSHLHKQIVLDALAAGKHVYCEAPLASSIEDAKAIATAAGGAKTIFQTGLQYRANKMHNHVRNFLGDMGKPTAGRAQWRRKTTWKAAAPTPEREREQSWRLFKASSLGLPGEVGIHQFDMFCWYLKALPVAVTAMGGVMARGGDGMEVPDTMQAVLEFPGGLRVAYDATITNSFDGAFETLLGPNFAMLIRDQRGWMFKETDSPLLGWEVYARKDKLGDETGIALVADATKLISQGKEPGKVGADLTKTALYQSVDAFLGSVRTNKKPAADALVGYQANVLAAKVQEAALAGGRVELPADVFNL
jgi:predicted dehydrogenase